MYVCMYVLRASNWQKNQNELECRDTAPLSASYISFEQRSRDSVTHYMCTSTDFRGVVSDNNSDGMPKFLRLSQFSLIRLLYLRL